MAAIELAQQRMKLYAEDAETALNLTKKGRAKASVCEL